MFAHLPTHSLTGYLLTYSPTYSSRSAHCCCTSPTSRWLAHTASAASRSSPASLSASACSSTARAARRSRARYRSASRRCPPRSTTSTGPEGAARHTPPRELISRVPPLPPTMAVVPVFPTVSFPVLRPRRSRPIFFCDLIKRCFLIFCCLRMQKENKPTARPHALPVAQRRGRAEYTTGRTQHSSSNTCKKHMCTCRCLA